MSDERKRSPGSLRRERAAEGDRREDPGPLGWALLTLRFLLELSALAALAVWGFDNGATTGTRLLLGIGAPLVAAGVWGAVVAPRARFEAPRAVRILAEVLVFASAVVALAATGRISLAIVFGALVLVDSPAAHALGLASVGARGRGR